MNINPYELLGLSSNSTIKDLKKAYYEFSLLCHPDRGGNCNEMDIVHKSYKYIKNQLENCNNLTYENLEKEFEFFCKNQEEKTPCFSDIYDESNDFIRDFNKKFSEEYQSNPFDKGYGKLMEEKIIKTDYNENDAEDFYKPLNNDFKTDMVVYKEPFSLPDTYGSQSHLNKKEISDFSHNTNYLQMSDYKIAFNNNQNLDELINNKNMNRNLEDLIKEREKIYENDYKQCIPGESLILNLQNKKINSIIKIQKIFRGFKCRLFIKRKNYYENINKDGYLDKYAIIIQKNIRRYICKKYFLQEKINKQIKEMEIKIQKLKNKKRSTYNVNKNIII